MREPGTERIYFPNLNGLRFIAAFLVIIAHIEQLKSLFGLPASSAPFVEIAGPLGVILFFVLSGFLITYLLLEEESRTNTIAVRQFYARRILRIWPLYFLIIIVALFVLPNIPTFSNLGSDRESIYHNLPVKIALYLFFLPNLVTPLAGFVPYASHTWSIGTEEQFYLTWPPALTLARKHRLFLMLLILAGYLTISHLLYSKSTDFLPFKPVLVAFWPTFNIDCMAIGGFFALLLHTKSSSLRLFRNKYLFYFALGLVTILMYNGVTFAAWSVSEIGFYKEFYAVWFGIIILNFAANSEIAINLESRPFRYLGTISYGLYMYHPLSIALALEIAGFFGLSCDIILYSLSLAITIGISALSYKYFESPFLRLKANFYPAAERLG